MAVLTAESFFTLLEQSELLPPNQLSEIRDQWPGHLLVDSQTFAQELVRRRWITHWQSQQILAGRSRFTFGKYKILEQLGVGGMGVVYKAEMVAMGRAVALKMMSRELIKNHEAVARFQREVRTAAKLNHPNVVTAYDAICEDQTYFLVMEYVNGTNLNQWLKRFAPLPVDWCCEVVRQGAMALQHAHEHGVVHRDIKPGNILVVGDHPNTMPVVKVLDMGLARVVQPEEGDSRFLTRAGQVLGTPDYIAPEQARDTREADVRCDIFSLGVTFFKLLAGQLPYGGTTPMEKIMIRNERPAPKVTQFRDDVPAPVAAILEKMLARNPDERFQEPWELAQALTPYSIFNRLSKAVHSSSSSGIMTQAFAEILLASSRRGEGEGGLSSIIVGEASSTSVNAFGRHESTTKMERAPIAGPQVVPPPRSAATPAPSSKGESQAALWSVIVFLSVLSVCSMGGMIYLLMQKQQAAAAAAEAEGEPGPAPVATPLPKRPPSASAAPSRTGDAAAPQGTAETVPTAKPVSTRQPAKAR